MHEWLADTTSRSRRRSTLIASSRCLQKWVLLEAKSSQLESQSVFFLSGEKRSSNVLVTATIIPNTHRGVILALCWLCKWVDAAAPMCRHRTAQCVYGGLAYEPTWFSARSANVARLVEAMYSSSSCS
eukprot:scpid33031/ scgid32448/ 